MQMEIKEDSRFTIEIPSGRHNGNNEGILATGPLLDNQGTTQGRYCCSDRCQQLGGRSQLSFAYPTLFKQDMKVDMVDCLPSG